MLPAVLRGFSEQIQYEVKFPLKSNGWEGKLCYLQQQQCCSLLVSNEPAEGFILLISLQEPRQHILLACSFPRGELQQGGRGMPWELPRVPALQHPTLVAFGTSVAAPPYPLLLTCSPVIPRPKEPLGAKRGNGIFQIAAPSRCSELLEMSWAHAVLGMGPSQG